MTRSRSTIFEGAVAVGAGGAGIEDEEGSDAEDGKDTDEEGNNEFEEEGVLLLFMNEF